MSLDEKVNKLVLEMGFSRAEATMALNDSSGDVEMAVDKLLRGEYAPPPYTPTGGPQGAHNAELLTSKVNTIDKPGEKYSFSSKKESESEVYPNMKNFFSGLTNRGKRPEVESEDPTAPPLLVDLSGDDSSGVSPYRDVQQHMQQQQQQQGPSYDQMRQHYDMLPPPYQMMEKGNKIKDWEKQMEVTQFSGQTSDGLSNPDFSASRSERCPVCFNSVVSLSGGREDIVCHKGKIFHHVCFMKKHGPQCAHCCFPLGQADKDHELSGKYLVYKNKDYHVECYEKYAGPRCCHCFNVIIEKPTGEFSGQYVIDKQKEYHIECMQKKMHSTWKAKNI